jgi:hypothetical protein
MWRTAGVRVPKATPNRSKTTSQKATDAPGTIKLLKTCASAAKTD